MNVEDEGGAEDDSPVLPRWVRSPLLASQSAERDEQPTSAFRITFYASGWPMRSMFAIKLRQRGNRSTELNYGLETSAQAWDADSGGQTPSDSIVLPYRPIPLGTLVNTAVWSLPWAVAFVLMIFMRQLRRHWRGWCPRCAYDLRRDFSRGCPECGWRRDAEANITTGS
ncbi:MAG: hypothetical protein EA377_10255 [Phycisphaerales bacterium]|nr:MAG: hypothetical protein EA377_10255 [Phycisphaerales bacterium]